MRFLKYASWIVLVPLDIITGVLAILFAPFVVPFYNEKTGHLPKGFRWMETFDNPIDGDGGHIRRWASIRYHLGLLGCICNVLAGCGETRLITSHITF